jgi:hypothetical protein
MKKKFMLVLQHKNTSLSSSSTYCFFELGMLSGVDGEKEQQE